MKYLLPILLVTMTLNANIFVNQNIKALYKDTILTEKEKNYIEFNKDINSDILQKALEKELNKEKIKDKNVISFLLEPAGKIKNFKFLVKADSAKINRITKKTIFMISKKFIRPSQNTEMRFIIHFNNKTKTIETIYPQKQKIYYQIIYPGTTRFDYSSKEYVRIFETSEDGFVNITSSPGTCAKISLLSDKNRVINGNLNPWHINKNILKGKYKVLIKVKRNCNINIQYIQ